MNKYPRKVLVVAMLNSIHTARWLSQFSDQKQYDFHLYSSNNALIHPQILNNKLFTIHQGDLEKVIKKINPDVIHTLEMQHSAYLVLSVRKRMKTFPLWFYTCWGSDILWFEKYKEHKKKIVEILGYIDALFSEDEESIERATEHYLYSKPFIKVPGPGGYKVNDMRKLVSFTPPSKRKIIAVKGYSTWVYKPEILFSALKLNAKLIKKKNFKIIIYVPGDIKAYVDELRKEGINVELLNWTPNYEEILILFSKSRINIASSLSDGIPNSMLEGMVMGAFPIQSTSKTISRYIKSFKNGILLKPLDVEGYSTAINKALTDDKIVDNAAIYNFDLIKNNFEYSDIKQKTLIFYNSFFKRINYNFNYLLKMYYWNLLGIRIKGNINIMKKYYLKYKYQLKPILANFLCKINPTYRKVLILNDRLIHLNNQLTIIIEKIDKLK